MAVREKQNDLRNAALQERPKLRRGHPPVDIANRRFRMLTALYPTEKRDRNSSVIWHCRCDCGREVDVPYEELMYSRIVSCGCRRREVGRELNDRLTRVAGTTVDLIRSDKVRADNKTGVKGVFMVRDRYRAEIRFRGQVYRLGDYDTLEKAAAARKKAEQCLHGEFLTYYGQWKAKAAADPAWGEANPVTVQVVRRDRCDFELILRPELT